MCAGRVAWWCCVRVVFCSVAGLVFLLPPQLHSQTPSITPGGVVNGASFSAPVVPGSSATVFGTNLASGQGVAGADTLPTTFLGTTVRMNGIAVPLIFVSPGQINLQVPWELAGSSFASVTVTTANGASAPVNVVLASHAPGVFTTSATGTGPGVFFRVAGGFISPSSPAVRGETIVLFGTGLGAVANQPPSGSVAASTTSNTLLIPSVTVGGVAAPVTFSRFLNVSAPVPVGSYEVGFTVPVTAPVGTSVPLVLTIGGVASSSVTIAVSAGCSYSIPSSSQAFSASGGNGSVTVTTSSGCPWTAESSASFVTITSGASGSGSGTVNYTAAANTGTTPLLGTLTIAGQTFAVLVDGTIPPASLSVSPGALNFAAAIGAAPSRQSLQIASSGTVNWTAAVTILSGSGWLTVTPPNGVATAVEPSTLGVEINYATLTAAGVYQAQIAVQESGGARQVIPVTVTLSEAGGRLLLSHAALLFRGAAGGAAPPAQTLGVSNGGQGSLDWSIPADLAPWLTVAPRSGTVGAGAAQTATLSVNPAGLAPDVYQVVVPVSAPSAANVLQFVTVTLHVAPAETPAGAAVSPSGLLFVALPGSGAPAGQGVTVSNTGGGTLNFAWQATTTSGGNWLSVTPAQGNTAGGPATAQVSVSASGLSAGFYRGKLTGTFTAGGTAAGSEQVEIVLVVAPAGTGLQRALPSAAQCAANTMELVLRTIGTGSVAPVSFPRPLVAALVNACGEDVNDATVVVTVEGRAIPLTALGGGQYSGTWVPEQQAAAVPVSFTALHPAYARVDRTVTVSTTAGAGGATLPLLLPGGVVEGAAFTRGRPLAPGSLISLFGSRFATTDAGSPSLPLERSLGGVSVQVDGEDVPLYFAGSGQINAQLPYKAEPGKEVSVAVKANGKFTTPQKYVVTQAQPNIFLAGNGWAILDVNSQLVTAANPAHAGDVLQIYATGLGETNPPGQTGEGAPAFSQVVAPVTVKVGGADAAVEYAGLAPGYVGLYQVNIRVPATVTPGDNVEVVIRQNGISSNPDRPVTIPVR